MSDPFETAYTRRAFLAHGVTLASVATTVPWWVNQSATAFAQAAREVSSIPGVPDERILVVIQLGGGNDGLNTIIPFGEREYYDARPRLAIPEAQALTLDNRRDIGLHPRLGGLKWLHDEGMLAIVQGVGYPNPNRSHFMSMDIWHTASESGVGDGWLGRFFDNSCAGRPEPESGVAIGRDAPLALHGRRFRPMSFESAELFRWTGEDVHDALSKPYAEITRSGPIDGVAPDSNAAFLMRTALDAQVSSARIREAATMKPAVEFPRTNLGMQLRLISSMIRAGMKTRVYYASMSGFDTHANQGGPQGAHANLLGEYGDAIRAFYEELRAQDSAERVLTMTFSEFGRRVGQNASGGTDHGAAAPMFLAGPMVRPGVLTPHPSLTDLQSGDLKHRVDFRSVYAGVIEDWLKGDATATLGGRFRAAKVIAGA